MAAIRIVHVIGAGRGNLENLAACGVARVGRFVKYAASGSFHHSVELAPLPRLAASQRDSSPDLPRLTRIASMNTIKLKTR
jgi:hypothetical protein